MEKMRPQSKREHFAHTIAQEFNDSGQVRLYLQYCRKYPLSLVYRAYAEARSVPPERVRKSRAAIFFYLVKRYAHERKQDTGH